MPRWCSGRSSRRPTRSFVSGRARAGWKIERGRASPPKRGGRNHACSHAWKDLGYGNSLRAGDGVPYNPRLPSQGRSLRFIVACVLGSFLLHGVAFGVLKEIEPPKIKLRRSEDIIRRREPKQRPRAHRVRLVTRRRASPRPRLRRLPRRPPPRARHRLRPRTTPPMASPPRVTPRPVLDLTMGAGVNASLTSGAGNFSVHVGDTALGDPSVAPMRPQPRPRPRPRLAPAAPPPRRRARPVPVYVKVLPRVLRVPRVAYPAAARRLQIEGTVRLEVTVGRDGRVIRVRVLKGLGYGLDQAAVRALRLARFQPAVGSNGRPMRYTIRYRYTFRLER